MVEGDGWRPAPAQPSTANSTLARLDDRAELSRRLDRALDLLAATEDRVAIMIRERESRQPGMTLDSYQAAARRTAGCQSIAVLALGVAGEAGEVADLVKKVVGHSHPLDQDKITKELGDVLWYVATLAHAIGVSLSRVAEVNVEKLKARYPDGFSAERSINRPP